MVEIVLMMSATPASWERFVPMIPEPTTTQTNRAVPKNSAIDLPTVVGMVATPIGLELYA
jgi:hypothetical protein